MVQKNTINTKNKIIIICGATATGKTSLAVECAKLLNTEIISADSMCIYKGLDIGTAKPSVQEMQNIKHHLINVISPKDTFTVSDYKTTAEKILSSLFSIGKIPIICGGTGFYINSILYDFSYGNGIGNPLVREKYKKLAETYGNKYVFDILYEKDSQSAEKLHFNDLKRVIRALEIFENGTKKSEIHDDLVPKYDYSAYCIDFPRDELYARIDSRVDEMLKNGLVSEVQSLMEKGVTISDQSMQGIGYKEVYSYLTNKQMSLNETVSLIKLNTRHYAKRQLTFFKRLEGLSFLEPQKTSVMAERIVKEL